MGLSLITTTDILLNEILIELKEINNKLISNNDKVTEITKPKKICKYCGKTHDRPVDYAICSRKNK